jgi:hypothetical protein
VQSVYRGCADLCVIQEDDLGQLGLWVFPTRIRMDLVHHPLAVVEIVHSK